MLWPIDPRLMIASLLRGMVAKDGLENAEFGPAGQHFGSRVACESANIRPGQRVLIIGVGKRGRHVALEGRWDSGIRFTEKTLQPGEVPTRHRSLGVVLAIF